MKKTKRARCQRRGRVSIRWKTLSVLGVFALTMIGLLWLFLLAGRWMRGLLQRAFEGPGWREVMRWPVS